MAETLRAGMIVGDRYELVRPLGAGGMGEVWEALQKPLGRRVALKTIHGSLADDGMLLARFKREAESAARLGHPNIVQVTDVAIEPRGLSYLVMEYLEGESLEARIAERGRLPVADVVSIARQILDALEVAHGAGIVHRDLKPANVYLVRHGSLGDLVKLVDFGIAKLVGGEGPKLTATGTMIGTPQYMAPEQVAGRSVDARADLWSLGVVMYEMLTGAPPFTGKDVGQLIGAILTETPRPIGDLRPDAPPAMGAVVAHALAKEPSSRPESAAAMRAALDVGPADEGSEALGHAATMVARSDEAPPQIPRTTPPSSRPAPRPVIPPNAASTPPARVSAPTPPERPAHGWPMWPLALAGAAMLVAFGAGLALWLLRDSNEVGPPVPAVAAEPIESPERSASAEPPTEDPVEPTAAAAEPEPSPMEAAPVARPEPTAPRPRHRRVPPWPQPAMAAMAAEPPPSEAEAGIARSFAAPQVRVLEGAYDDFMVRSRLRQAALDRCLDGTLQVDHGPVAITLTVGEDMRATLAVSGASASTAACLRRELSGGWSPPPGGSARVRVTLPLGS